MGGLPELSLKEKVLLWLVAVEEDGEVGLAGTQAGISASTGQSRGHTSRTLTPLVKNEILREERVRATGFSRSLKAYRVTGKGRTEYENLRRTLLHTPVPVRESTGETTMRTLGKLLPVEPKAGILWEALDRLASQGHLDPDPDALLARPSHRRPRFETDLSQSPPRAPLFVGRRQELETLREWSTGGTGVFVVEAPGGTGKSSLLLKLLEDHRPNRHVLWVRLTKWSTQDRFVLTLDTFIRRLGRSTPSLRSMDPEPLADHFLRCMKGLPLLLVLDDMQKAPPGLLGTIGQLVQIAHRLPTLKVILAGRAVELPDQRIPPELRLRLGPLDRPEGEHLLAERGVDPGVQRGILDAAGGVPLFLELLAQRSMMGHDDPVTQDELITDLGAGLSELHQETLSVVSAIRIPFPEGFLRRLRVGSRSTLDELVRTGFLKHRSDGSYEMHDLVASAFYDQVPYSRRVRIHSQLAEAYRPRRRSILPQDEDEDELAQITEYLHHLVAADRRDEAVRWVLRNQSRIMEQAQRLFREDDERLPVEATG